MGGDRPFGARAIRQRKRRPRKAAAPPY